MASGGGGCGCLMTYGTAVEHPTGRVHRHVQALPRAALRHNTVRFRSSWNLGPPYSFRLALLRAIHRSDLSTEASPGIALIHALQRTSRALPEHTRLGGTNTGDEEGSVQDSVPRDQGQDSVPRDQGQEFKALGEPYWEVGLALPLIELAGVRACNIGCWGGEGNGGEGRGQGGGEGGASGGQEGGGEEVEEGGGDGGGDTDGGKGVGRGGEGGGQVLYVFNVVSRGDVHRHAGLLGHEVVSSS